MTIRRKGVVLKNFTNYSISPDGQVYNIRNKLLKQTVFKGTRYVKLYKNGVRYTLNVSTLLQDAYGIDGFSIDTDPGEVLFQYKDTHYYITSNCRVYNYKLRKWLTTVIRNGSPSVCIRNNGKTEVVYLLKFLKSKGGVVCG